MSLWPCSFPSCEESALRDADCDICGRHLCLRHNEPSSHVCLELKDDVRNAYRNETKSKEIAAFLGSINRDALEAWASMARGGVEASLASSSLENPPHVGGMNFHIPLTYEDGIACLVRSPRTSVTCPPPTLRDRIIRSEGATLRALHEAGCIVPRVFDIGLTGDESDGADIPYLLIEKVDGTDSFMSLDASSKPAFIGQVACAYLSFERVKFSAVGSPIASGGEVGPLLNPEFATLSASGELSLVGPFTSVTDRLTSCVEVVLHRILAGTQYLDHPVDAYLAHLEIRSLAVTLTDKDSRMFYIKHADDKGDQWLVNNKNELAAIIDWE